MENDFQQILTKIIQQLKMEKLLPSIDKIYLFGSRARGDASERSDIDLAILCTTNSPKIWLDIYESIENTETLLKIDLINLAEASSELKKKIFDEGKIIYESTKNSTKF